MSMASRSLFTSTRLASRTARRTEGRCIGTDAQPPVPLPFDSVPGPRPAPLIGNWWRYLPLIGTYRPDKLHLNAQYNCKRYGPVVREQMLPGGMSIVHLFRPDDMEQLFRSEDKTPGRRSHRALLKYRKERPRLYMKGGLFSDNGPEWYAMRRMSARILLDPAFVASLVEPCATITRDFIGFIDESRHGQLDLMDILYKWALENTGWLSLGLRLGCLGDVSETRDATLNTRDVLTLIRSAHATIEAVMRTEHDPFDKWDTDPRDSNYRQLVAAQDSMASIVRGLFAEKLRESNETSGSSLVDSLWNDEAKRKWIGSNETQDDYEKDLFCLVMDMFLAGIDTTSFSGAFLLYHLATNPDKQEVLREEIISSVGDGAHLRDMKSFRGMSYLRACVKESMRLQPVSIGVGRVLKEPLLLSNYQIPSETMIITHNQVASLQEEHFPNAHAFQPERWLSSATKPNPFCSLPFGFGARMCVGRRISEMELYVLASLVLCRFRLAYSGPPVGTFTRLVNVPDKPIRIRFEPL